MQKLDSNMVYVVALGTQCPDRCSIRWIDIIEGYTVTRNMHDEIPEMPDEVWDGDCYVYKLGPAIIPSKAVKTGKIFRNGRVGAMLDTLLTCDTISEARDMTQARLG